jgi:hypothetical protein
VSKLLGSGESNESVVHQQKRSQNYSLLAWAFTICYYALFVLSTLLIAKKGKRKKEREKKGKREEKAQNFCCLSRRQLVNRSGAAGARRLLIVRSGRGGQHPQLHSSGDATDCVSTKTQWEWLKASSWRGESTAFRYSFIHSIVDLFEESRREHKHPSLSSDWLRWCHVP